MHPDAETIKRAGAVLAMSPTMPGNQPMAAVTVGRYLTKMSAVVNSGNSIPARRGKGYEEAIFLARMVLAIDSAERV